MSRKRPKFGKDENSYSYEGKEKKEQEKEEYDAFGFMKDKKQTAAVAGIFFLFGFVLSWFLSPTYDGMVTSGVPAATQADASRIGAAGVAFINKYFVSEGDVAVAGL